MFKKNVLALILGLIMYFSSLQFGFSQDDFIHLFHSKADNLGEAVKLVNPYSRFSDIFFYRPLSTQVYFFINQALFGLNPVIFKVEILIIFAFSISLFYKLVLLVYNQKGVALLADIFYATSSIHFLSIYYISGSQQIMRTMFLFLSLLLFVQSKKKGNIVYIGSLVSFIAALLSKESSIIFPIYLIVFEILRRRFEPFIKVARETILYSLPFIAILAVYLLVRAYSWQSVFNEGGYFLSLSPINVLGNLKWYLLWTFGLPEVISTYPSLSLATALQFARDFPYAYLTLICFILLILILILEFFKKTFSLKGMFCLGGLYLIGLMPMLLLSDHKYPHYLDMSLFAFFVPVSIVISTNVGKVYFLTFFLVLQISSILISQNIHWTTHRSKVADYYYNQLKSDIGGGNQKFNVVFIGGEKQLNELSVALARKYALDVWFPDKIEGVYYLKSEVFAERLDNKLLKYVTIY